VYTSSVFEANRGWACRSGQDPVGTGKYVAGKVAGKAVGKAAAGKAVGKAVGKAAGKIVGKAEKVPRNMSSLAGQKSMEICRGKMGPS